MMGRTSTPDSKSLFEEQESNALRSGINKLVGLGFTIDHDAVVQILENYGIYSLARLITEYKRTKCSLLGYVVVAICIEKNSYLSEGECTLRRLENDEANKAFMERRFMREALRRELDTQRAE